MGQIGRDAGGVDDIVERELIDKGRGLEQQREGLMVCVSLSSLVLACCMRAPGQCHPKLRQRLIRDSISIWILSSCTRICAHQP